jgi:hypothetical protein
MKNTIKLFGIIALAAVIGLSFTNCGGGGGGGGDPDIAGTYTGTSFNFTTSGGYGGSMGESDYLSTPASDVTLTVEGNLNATTNNAGGLLKLYGGGKYYQFVWVNQSTGEFAINSKPISGGTWTLYKPEPPGFLNPENTTFGGFYNSTTGTIRLILTYWESASVYTTGELVLTKQP